MKTKKQLIIKEMKEEQIINLRKFSSAMCIKLKDLKLPIYFPFALHHITVDQ